MSASIAAQLHNIRPNFRPIISSLSWRPHSLTDAALMSLTNDRSHVKSKKITDLKYAAD
jgi:hypothetical protein